jgi:hypothetical protein
VGGFAFTPSPRSNPRHAAARKHKLKVIRRLRGFLIESSGKESKVAFVQGGQTTIYYLPTAILSKNKITIPDQPFEMDEVEFPADGGLSGFGYVFRPIASAKDRKRELLELDAETEEELRELLRAETNAAH